MTTLIVTIAAALLTLGFWGHSASQIPRLFKLNKLLQTEGYYSAEFEFKMLGMAYWLDHGEYAKATNSISILKEKMENRIGFVKVPRFSSKEDEMDFYLSLQNPRTGAFMDDSFPYCTYEGPTGNVLEHLEELSIATGRPLKLKYPLSFFDSIAEPTDLRAYLDDLSHIGFLGSKLPESSFHIVRDLISYTKSNNIVERNGLYCFSTEWKHTLIKWFLENQDSTTGYWGPRSRYSNTLLKLDLHNTGSIAKNFVDSVGNDLYPEFPLRYRKQMFRTTLQVLSEPEPDLKDEDEWHGWTLRRGKGIALLCRYLWKTADEQDQMDATQEFDRFIRFLFKQYYIEDEGAFRFYPDGSATVDGTGTAIGALQDLGYFSLEKRNRLWYGYPERLKRIDRHGVVTLYESDFDSLFKSNEINSVRFYAFDPNLNAMENNVCGVTYVGSTPIPDVVEIAPRIKQWADSSVQSMGNWVSRQSIVNDLTGYSYGIPGFISRELPLDKLNELYWNHGTLTAIGFDIFQVPRRVVHITQHASDR